EVQRSCGCTVQYLGGRSALSLGFGEFLALRSASGGCFTAADPRRLRLFAQVFHRRSGTGGVWLGGRPAADAVASGVRRGRESWNAPSPAGCGLSPAHPYTPYHK